MERRLKLSTNKKFYMTFVYGINLEEQRQTLWDSLRQLALSMGDSAWCVLGDFSSVLHHGDRIGGVAVNDGEIREYAECLHHCGFQEF